MIFDAARNAGLTPCGRIHANPAGVPLRAGTSRLRFAPVLAVLAMLGGCAQPAPQIGGMSTARVVTADAAFAVPDPGGPLIATVIETPYANAVQQDILLATSARTPGQNMLRIQFFGPVDSSAGGQSRLRDGYLPIGNVGSEMRTLLPGIAMQRSPFYVQNKYGPFGYAVGRSASGDTCFYGWQRIASTGATQTWVGNKGSIQIRLRVCDQTASERRLLEMMYGFTIKSYFKSQNWNPYGDPSPPPESLGRAGSPVYPVGQTRFETVIPQATPAPRAAAAPPRQPAAAQAEPPQQLPAPIGPTVPPPPGQTRIDAANQAPATVPAPANAGPSSIVAPASNTTLVPPPPCGAANPCR